MTASYRTSLVACAALTLTVSVGLASACSDLGGAAAKDVGALPDGSATDVGPSDAAAGDALLPADGSGDAPGFDGVAACACREGACCDGCRFLAAGTVCAPGAIEEVECRPATACGGTAWARRADRTCSGASALCDGPLASFGAWDALAECGSDARCVPEAPTCRPTAGCRCADRCDDFDPCTLDDCDAAGGCVHAPLACDDADACTDDRCEGGVCVHARRDCGDDNPCTEDVCDRDAGCGHAPAAWRPCRAATGEVGACVDSACCVPACAERECGADGCGGRCGICDDGDPCTVDSCGEDGRCARAATSCDDAIDCTLDECVAGAGCRHTLDDARCEDGRGCSEDACTPDGCVRDERACSCEDDALEEDDTPAGAHVVEDGTALPDLRAVYGDDDWWRLAASAGATIEVTVAAPDAAGLVVDLRGECAALAATRTDTSEGFVVRARVEAPGSQLVRVRETEVGACTSYALELHVTPPATEPLTCNVPCPLLDGYAVRCNAREHCEYYRPDATGWRRFDVLVWIPAGTFPLGPGEGIPITFAHGYWIDVYETTAAAFAEFLNEHGNECVEISTGDLRPCTWENDPYGRTGSTWGTLHHDDEGASWRPGPFCRALPWGPFGPCEEHPASHLSWAGAETFCRWRGAELCSESRWERAGKGPTQQAYPWGDAPSPGALDWDPGLANCLACADGFRGELAPVEAFPAGMSPSGCHQMAGGLSEWVLDTQAWTSRAPEYNVPSADVPRDGSPWTAGRPDFHVSRGSFIGDEWNDVFGARSGYPELEGVRCCVVPKCESDGEVGP